MVQTPKGITLMEREMGETNKQGLASKPLVRRIRHKLLGHDWEIIKTEHWYRKPMYKYDSTSRRFLKCIDCSLEQEQFYSEIFWDWLPRL